MVLLAKRAKELQRRKRLQESIELMKKWGFHSIVKELSEGSHCEGIVVCDSDDQVPESLKRVWEKRNKE